MQIIIDLIMHMEDIMVSANLVMLCLIYVDALIWNYVSILMQRCKSTFTNYRHVYENISQIWYWCSILYAKNDLFILSKCNGKCCQRKWNKYREDIRWRCQVTNWIYLFYESNLMDILVKSLKISHSFFVEEHGF